MIAAACGAPGQRQHLRQRDKSIDIGLNSGWDELTGTCAREHVGLKSTVGPLRELAAQFLALAEKQAATIPLPWTRQGRSWGA
jgi:hypothetical protein